MAKETRKQYLERRVKEAENLGRTVDVTIPNNPTKKQLKELDDKINKVLYPTGVYGVTDAVETVAPPVVDTTQRTDWAEYTKQLFKNYGLESLAPRITEYAQEGFSPETITLKLQETPEYKQRFAGNEARRKAGLPVLSPAEYLSAESSYRDIMRNANLPKGFYDDPNDFSKFISVDVSPAELKSRVDAAALSLENADPFYTGSLQRLYGLSSGDMVAYALDPERALPLITRQVQAAQFGAEAARQGLQVTTPMAETYTGQLGVSQAQARQGFEDVASILPEAQKLSQITPGAAPVSFEEVTSAVLGGEQSAEYKKRLKILAEAEQSRFAGQSGVGQPSLGMSTEGQF